MSHDFLGQIGFLNFYIGSDPQLWNFFVRWGPWYGSTLQVFLITDAKLRNVAQGH